MLKKSFPSFRNLCLLGFLGCLGLIATAFYMQYVQGLEPCPLCMMQRMVVYLTALLFLLALVINPNRSGRRWFAGLIALVNLGGVGLASRQLWLQSLPPDQVPACGPDLDYMLEVLPWQEIISVMLRGTGDCAKIQWTLLGLSIPGWTLLCFIGFIVIGLMLWTRKPINSELH